MKPSNSVCPIFTMSPHRLEYVVNVHGITFINDSKATNVNSTWYALESPLTILLFGLPEELTKETITNSSNLL